MWSVPRGAGETEAQCGPAGPRPVRAQAICKHPLAPRPAPQRRGSSAPLPSSRWSWQPATDPRQESRCVCPGGDRCCTWPSPRPPHGVAEAGHPRPRGADSIHVKRAERARSQRPSAGSRLQSRGGPGPGRFGEERLLVGWRNHSQIARGGGGPALQALEPPDLCPGVLGWMLESTSPQLASEMVHSFLRTNLSCWLRS